MVDGRTEHAARAADLREAYELHATAILRLCVLLAGRQDVAEDLVQETFARVSLKLDGLSSDEVGGYLRTTALNLWRNRIRRLRVEGRFRPPPPTRSEVPFEERDALWRAVRKLPARQRACLVLRYYEELSERETAEALGCSVGTVKSQTSRALKRLRREMRDGE